MPGSHVVCQETRPGRSRSSEHRTANSAFGPGTDSARATAERTCYLRLDMDRKPGETAQTAQPGGI